VEQQEIELLRIHEQIFTYLMKRRESNHSLYFSMREKNNKARLEKGYWFIGYNHYLQVSFWSGRDWTRKIYHIAFVVLKLRGEWRSLIHFSCKQEDDLAEFLGPLAKLLGGGFTNVLTNMFKP
jgi:hypothetical protein